MAKNPYTSVPITLVSGTVKAIQIFHTVLTTIDNKELFIPNGPLSSGNITNYTKNELRRVDFTISVEYGTEVEKVKKVTLELLRRGGPT